MPSKKLRFILFGNEYQTGKTTAIRHVLDFLAAADAEVYVDKPFLDYLRTVEPLYTKGVEELSRETPIVDFAISLGGDGTFLKAADRIAPLGTPIIGVNMGRLGFLADVLPTEVDEALEAVYRGDYTVEYRAAVAVSTDGEQLVGSHFALNEIAVLKQDNASMISIRTSVDGEYLVTYQADGLIVSTPTGSTAYSLSNGGPIMLPQTNVLCLTPVAPHSLNIRPIVINNTSEVELEVESRSHNFLVAIDGRSYKLRQGTHLSIRRADFDVKIVKRTGRRYFSTLREKMMWGADQRQ